MPASQLVPVTIIVGGRKRTVMASLDEAAAISRGETPPVRAFDNGSGRYVPWYDYQGYDPYRDYYGGFGGPGLGTLIDFYIITDLLGPSVWGGYSPWGFEDYGYGMPMPAVIGGDVPGFYGGGNDGYSFFGDGGSADNGAVQDMQNSGGQDFFGQQDYTDPNPGGTFDTGGSDFSGGTDSGGGFDFGGGDSGGGFDSGGGGFDFGGGDGS
jgi:hypothetical protein